MKILFRWIFNRKQNWKERNTHSIIKNSIILYYYQKIIIEMYSIINYIMSENTELKEYNVSYSLAPKYDKECNKLFYYFPWSSIFEIKFKNKIISNQVSQQPIITQFI
jgi:hypothetical protein